jgi:N-acyl-D-aspartate/D-glutamate deacylase
VIGGNCGFSIAPVEEADIDYMTRLLARVEGMPLESLEAAVPWDWRTFGDYLKRFEGQLGINAGFFVGHTALRRKVPGADAERHATASELDRLRQLLREGLEAGGLGFATGTSPTHNDAAGRPVPNRFASREEYVELAQVQVSTKERPWRSCPTRTSRRRSDRVDDGHVGGCRPADQLEPSECVHGHLGRLCPTARCK